MRKWSILLASAAFALVSACVTINVYFPAAAAEKAAAEFIDEVIGAPEAPAANPSQSPKIGAILRMLSPIGTAHAQADISIDNPQIQAIKDRMAQRFQSTLEPHFAAGALGFTRDGRVEVRDQAAVPLAARAAVTKAVADENRDRDAVYREIAVANGHPEWEAQIRETFAAQWIERAKAGWYYQDASGSWQQK